MDNVVLQEAYYGKLPELAKIEDLLGVISKKVKANPKKCNPNRYPENQQIQQLFCKLFGFKDTYLYWEPFNYGNAYTIAMNALILFSDKKDAIIKRDNKGYYDKSRKSVLTVYASVGLILTDNLTPGEILATILHEIGHNFDISKYHLVDYLIDAITSFGKAVPEYKQYANEADTIKLQTYKAITKEENKIYKDSKKREEINKKNDELSKIQAFHDTWLNFPLFRTVKGVFKVVISPFKQLKDIGLKTSEVFADSFATAYGYGTELISALNKLGNESKGYYYPKSGLGKFFWDLSNFHDEVFAAFGDCHGTNQERCKDCLEKLQYDLKHNDFPTGLRKELIDEINKTTDLYKAYTSKSETERMAITRLWRYVVRYVFNGRVGLAKFFPRHKV